MTYYTSWAASAYSWLCSTPIHSASGFQIASHGLVGSIWPVELTDCGPSGRGVSIDFEPSAPPGIFDAPT